MPHRCSFHNLLIGLVPGLRPHNGHPEKAIASSEIFSYGEHVAPMDVDQSTSQGGRALRPGHGSLLAWRYPDSVETIHKLILADA